MVNNSLFKIYGNIEYNTLSRLPLVTGLSYGGLITASTYVIDESPSLGLAMNLISSIAVYASYLCHKTKGKIYSKEIKELRELYYVVLGNYHLINEIFDLKTPLEIYTMYKEALKNEYLSVDKNFEYSESNIKDLETIYEIVPITGKGVCRHIAPMLRDILKREKINSNVLIVKIQPFTYERAKIQIRKKVEKEYNGNNPEIVEEIIKYYSKLEKKRIESSYMAEQPEYHAITLAEYDKKTHLLDATQEKIYKINPKDNGLIMDETMDDIEIKDSPTIFIGTKKEYEIQQQQLLLPNTDIEDDKKIIKATEETFKKNKDVFEKLYRENHELYEEINQKILKFKR